MSNIFESIELAVVPPPTDDQPHLCVIGTFDRRNCSSAGTYHVGGLVLEDDSRIVEADAITMMDAGRVLYMRPPVGAPAHEACKALGAKLLLAVRACPHCEKRVLFA